MTNARYGEGEPVRAVGWAESDYWARRTWQLPFNEDLDPPPPEWGDPPSLSFLGCPDVLSFKRVYDFEREQPNNKGALLATAQYRVMTDGAFLTFTINGAHGVRYFYGSNDPAADDLPVAIEVQLESHRDTA